MSAGIAALIAISLLIRAYQLPKAHAWLFALPLACMLIGGLSLLVKEHETLRALPIKQALHGLLAQLAMAILALCVLQAILLILKNYGLRHQKNHTWHLQLPALQRLERIFFYTLLMGFVVLSLSLVAVYFEHPAPNLLSPKILLSCLAWLSFGTLLLGHYRAGWRGPMAFRWLSGGLILLISAYVIGR